MQTLNNNRVDIGLKDITERKIYSGDVVENGCNQRYTIKYDPESAGFCLYSPVGTKFRFSKRDMLYYYKVVDDAK